MADPVLAYGRTKRQAERLLEGLPGVLIARLSLLYGPSLSGSPTFFDQTVTDLCAGRARTFFEDEFRTPLDYNSAVNFLLTLANKEDLSGLVHMGGPERMSRYELMRQVAEGLGLDTGLVRRGRMADVDFGEPRPVDVSLDSGRLIEWLPDLEVDWKFARPSGRGSSGDSCD